MIPVGVNIAGPLSSEIGTSPPTVTGGLPRSDMHIAHHGPLGPGRMGSRGGFFRSIVFDNLRQDPGTGLRHTNVRLRTIRVRTVRPVWQAAMFCSGKTLLVHRKRSMVVHVPVPILTYQAVQRCIGARYVVRIYHHTPRIPYRTQTVTRRLLAGRGSDRVPGEWAHPQLSLLHCKGGAGEQKV
ncbi:hypothetical protein K466DRAFT_592481 [Polyporus arcularius HHB13444]|uniref:Uncharacterized protein n=1 Tax=Polyporus arcularius HHB13444 TaxID=1314778 RepID=A0A5C3P0H2_9APHY|nr:hypothetical protein K466DRAFT_592481 [Polyporus arcularius HHB13444]